MITYSSRGRSCCSRAANSFIAKKEIGDNSSSPAFHQPQLTMGAPGDSFEKEADAMADRVMRKTIPGQMSFLSAQDTIHRKCAECEKEEKIHRKESNADSGPVATSLVHNAVNSSGNTMDRSTKSFMESRFHYDFSNVKIHTDDLAEKSATSIHALAYTTGNHIVFNKGQYSPETDGGRRLLAHELTHVIQQNSGGHDYVASKSMPGDFFVQREEGDAGNEVQTGNSGSETGAWDWVKRIGCKARCAFLYGQDCRDQCAFDTDCISECNRKLSECMAECDKN